MDTFGEAPYVRRRVQRAIGMLDGPGGGTPDDLDPARGLLAGALFGVLMWALLIATCFVAVKG